MGKICLGCGSSFEPPSGYESNNYCKTCYKGIKAKNGNGIPVICHLTDTDKSILCQALLKSLIAARINCKKEEIMAEAQFYYTKVINSLSEVKK